MKGKMKIWFWLMTISSLIYITWRAFFTLPFGYGLVAMIAGIALFVSELISMVEAIIQYVCMSKSFKLELPDIEDEDYPDVDVFIATHSESADLLFKTVNGCVHMEYPDKNKVHIYLCDDSNRPEIKKLADDFGVGYFGLERNKDAKAGNLNNAISKTHSPLIVTFDADMIPRSEFLLKTVGYFMLPKMICENGVWRKRTEEEIDKDYKIGFVQTPQSFYNPDLFQYNFYAENNIPNEQDFFFREINIGRNTSNSAIYAGSNTIISREALEEVGGIRTHTITEDFATGMDIQEKNYTCYAIPDVLASGLAPEDLPNLIKQRQRWGRGCVQTVRSFKFLFGKLPFFTKLSYLSCLFYWWTFLRRIIYILAPILYAVFGVVSVKIRGLEFLFIWIPSYLIYNHSLKLLSGKTRDQKWSNIVDTILAPYLIMPILLETIGIKKSHFDVTNKNKGNSKNTRLLYATPHIILLAATVWGLVCSIKDLVLYKNFLGVVVLFWLILNSYFLFMAVLFMTGRVNYRKSERFVAKLQIAFDTCGKERVATTCDVAEGGLSFITDFPEYLENDVEFRIKDGKWSATVKGDIVHVTQRDGMWKYSVRLGDIDFENKKEYFEIVYDRYPSLAEEIKSNVWIDVTNFFKRKFDKTVPSHRHLPRIAFNKLVSYGNRGVELLLVDFNYRYMTIEGANKNEFSLRLNDDVILNLKRTDARNKKGRLFEITNYSEVCGTEAMRNILQAIVTI